MRQDRTSIGVARRLAAALPLLFLAETALAARCGWLDEPRPYLMRYWNDTEFLQSVDREQTYWLDRYSDFESCYNSWIRDHRARVEKKNAWSEDYNRRARAFNAEAPSDTKVRLGKDYFIRAMREELAKLQAEEQAIEDESRYLDRLEDHIDHLGRAWNENQAVLRQINERRRGR